MKSKSIIIFLLISSLIYGQNNIEDLDLIPIDHLKNDLQTIKSNLESIHPGLYTYTKKEELEAFFTRAEQKIINPMSDIEFYRLLAPLQSKIKNGHTMIIPSEKWSNYKDSQKPLFPFEIYYNNKSLYVLKNLSEDESINNGIEIISINGESAQNIISQLLNSITKDGNNNTYPAKLLQLGFLHWYADIIGTPETFVLEFKLNNQKLYTKKIFLLK